MEREFLAGDVLFGVFYPRGYILAVFDELSQAELAQITLQQQGIDDDAVTLRDSERALSYYASWKQDLSALSRAAAKLPLARAEQAVLNSYLEFARQGRVFLTVRARDEEIDDIREALGTNGAYAMRYYGDWTTTDLGGQPLLEEPNKARAGVIDNDAEEPEG